MFSRHRGLAHFRRWLAAAVSGGVLLYFALGALLIHCTIDKAVLRYAGSGIHPSSMASVVIATGNGSVSVPSVGSGSAGCVLIFPGQHGRNATYEASIVPALTVHGVTVYLFSYDAVRPPATLTFENIFTLARGTTRALGQRCGRGRLVVVGRSMGAMVAAYAVSATKAAGLVLDSASPQFAVAIRTRLTQRWFTRPWLLLPIERLLPDDYSLREALSKAPLVRGVIFQGSDDRRTPLRDLQKPGSVPAQLSLIPIAGARHSNVYLVAHKTYVAAILAMLGIDASAAVKSSVSAPVGPPRPKRNRG